MKLYLFRKIFIILITTLFLSGCALVIPTPTTTPIPPTETVFVQTYTPSVAPTLTNTPDPFPGWAFYDNPDYGFLLRYPEDWSFVPVTRPPEEGGRYLLLEKDGFQLTVSYRFYTEPTPNRSNTPDNNNEFEKQERGTVFFLGEELEKSALVQEDNIIQINYAQVLIDEVVFQSQLSQAASTLSETESSPLPRVIQEETDQILSSFELIPRSSKLPPPTLFAEDPHTQLEYNRLFDLDTGSVEAFGEHHFFEFGIKSTTVENTIILIPGPKAAFAFADISLEEPTLEDCLLSGSYAGVPVTLNPLNYYICYHTSERRYGYLHFKAIEFDQVIFDWHTYDVVGPDYSSGSIDDGTVFQSFSDRMTFVKDISVSDYTKFAPLETFVKTWQLRNVGEETWTKNYAVVFFSGDPLGAPLVNPLEHSVSPGSTIDISLPMTAPLETGEYTSRWMLRNEDGVLFGSGSNAHQHFYTKIIVEGTPIEITPTATSTVTPEPTLTPFLKGSMVTEAQLEADPISYNGDCPTTIEFSGVITSQGQGGYTYELEAGSDTSDYEFYPALPEKTFFTSDGTNQLEVNFTLDIDESLEGWARIFISSPNIYRSEPVQFLVECAPKEEEKEE